MAECSGQLAFTGLDPGYTDAPVRYETYDGTLRSLFPPYRHYMVGKLIRQDRETAHRSTLHCACHDEPVKVFGPSVTQSAYDAYCAVTSECIATTKTMEQLWDTVTSAPISRA